jgi:hypothetical protein
VPLHGHEEVCPSCGEKQYVKPEYRQSNLPKPPGVNPVPIVIAVVILGIAAVIGLQNSWVGEMMKRGPVQDDPMDKISMADARQLIETGLTQGLTAVSATAKFKYMSAGTETTKADPKPVELQVDTKLTDPKLHKAIVDPIKQYMEKAQVTTLTMNDSKSHATWTYNLAPPAPAGAADQGADQAQPAPAQ